MILIQKIKKWNSKYDIWSLSSDFFFILGVLLFNWNPVLLILWFMVDTSTMIFFGVILFRKEGNDWITTLGFTIASLMTVALLAGLYRGVEKFIIELEMQHIVNSDPMQIINPIVLPVILSCGILNHYSHYLEELERMRNDTYRSSYIKHFFIRYLLVSLLILFIITFYIYFQIGIVIALVGIKSLLRLLNKKFRTII